MTTALFMLALMLSAGWMVVILDWWARRKDRDRDSRRT